MKVIGCSRADSRKPGSIYAASRSRRYPVIALLSATVLWTALGCRSAWAVFIGPQLPYSSFGHLINKGPLCAPTATINSFQYLDNLDPTVHLLPGAGKAGDLASSRDALANGWTSPGGVARAGMGGCGATEQSQWEAKAHWVTDFAKSPVSLHGMVNQPADTTKTWFEGDALTSGLPTWDFLLNELMHKEDVELVIFAADNSFAHALTLTSLKFDDTNGNQKWDPTEARMIDYLDPNDPTKLYDGTLTLATDGCLRFDWTNVGSMPPTPVCIHAAYAESVPEPAGPSIFAIAVSALLLRRRWIRQT